MKKHWYFITYYICTVCGRSDPDRERRYTPRPEDPEDRYGEPVITYCGCMDETFA